MIKKILKNMKAKVVTRVMAAVMAAVLLTGCSTEDSDNVVGNVSVTECKDSHEAGSSGTPKLKLTREGNNIRCELLNYKIDCDRIDDVKVSCERSVYYAIHNLYIQVDGKASGEGGVRSSSVGHVNISFTLYDPATDIEDVIGFFLNGRELGDVYFRYHKEVEIDLYTLKQTYDRWADYSEEIERFTLTHQYYDDQQRNNDGFNIDPYMDIYIFKNPVYVIQIQYDHYVLPCDYTKFDVVMDKEDDNTLVIRFVTDGTYSEACDDLAALGIKVKHAFKDSYHLKINPHTAIVKDEDGTEHEETVYDFDRVVSGNGNYHVDLKKK